MKYLRLRFKLWRINTAIRKNRVIAIGRLLGVAYSDKTIEEYVLAVELAHRKLMDEAIFAGKD